MIYLVGYLISLKLLIIALRSKMIAPQVVFFKTFFKEKTYWCYHV